MEQDTIFSLLGFVGKNELFKEKIFYSGSQPYNCDCNEQVYFTLSGSTKDQC